jgi:hypothetical protein
MGEGFKATEKIVVRVDCNAVEDFSTLGLAERVQTFACLKGKGPGLSYPKSRKPESSNLCCNATVRAGITSKQNESVPYEYAYAYAYEVQEHMSLWGKICSDIADRDAQK